MSNVHDVKIIRASLILTASYVAGTVLTDVERYNQLILALKYTKGSLTSFQVKVEFSYDGVNFFQQTFLAVSGAVSTGAVGSYTFAPAASANFQLEIPIKAHSIKVSVKGTGTMTNSLLEVKGVLGIV